MGLDERFSDPLAGRGVGAQSSIAGRLTIEVRANQHDDDLEGTLP